MAIKRKHLKGDKLEIGESCNWCQLIKRKTERKKAKAKINGNLK